MQAQLALDNPEPALQQALEHSGHALIRGLLDAEQCRQLADLYRQPALFRSRILMARHGFGRGEYQYFRYPLPSVVEQVRQDFYPALAEIANTWNARLKLAERYPATLPAFLQRCHQAGQARPTPLLLRYQPGDYNCLHQDLYGELHFPLQMAILLSRPGIDFSGGEFCLSEYSSHEQRAEVVPLRQGDAVIFPVAARPVPGLRGGWRKVLMRHGVSEVLSGQRHTLGVIFHDAR